MTTVNKVVLAVHGIGDQARNSTVLSTALRFCECYEHAELLPLGGFFGALQPNRPAFVMTGPKCPAALRGIGFGEIYWADLARAVAEDGHTLQETKEWARSVVSRIRVLASARDPKGPAIHYGQIEYVLNEMIEAIHVAESLLFLAKKAGLFEFDLKKVLDDYLGDVQIVADFALKRREILDQLHLTMGEVNRTYPDAEIFLVSHSEGTVVAFLGLLEAMTNPVAYPWIKQVRGFMTMGSPIDKHLIMWPAIFSGFYGPDAALAKSLQIRWCNYTDNGDPVGFELDTAREWLGQAQPGAPSYSEILRLAEADDYYFTRYPMPGKAHVDYWNDAEVFDHFILNVVARPYPAGSVPRPGRITELKKGPRNKFWAWVNSYFTAYALPLALVFGGVYGLFKGIESYLDPGDAKELVKHPNYLRNVLAVGCLVAGSTVWLRVNQLVRLRWNAWGCYVGGLAAYVVLAASFYFLFTNEATNPEVKWLTFFTAQLDGPWNEPRLGLLLMSGYLVVLVMLSNARWLRSLLMGSFSPPVLGVSAIAVPAPDSNSTPKAQPAHRPASPPLIRNTLRTMLLVTAAALAWNGFLYTQSPELAEHTGALWPLVLGTIAFLYLWRLGALVFDLVFVWHRYIRHSGMLTFLKHNAWDKNAPRTHGGRSGTGNEPSSTT